ncbi:MAG: tRNA (5-methylaminomethyl-2-thiouridylate)-methyltransferase [Gammaproteobacteria bacterium]|nr:tRNA (5-methylaminomethyl-2-thiouridylate)-methyltransferase [Gammaproteobacteria bacterium]MBU1656203.1 tRNA (5-methylaminomethyl-2-thiouridylate)-methyltransferase [Gammaproteobacteria bacterium]MBU1959768.1 tRNA (5-methylaminomethyl-2-thiouridylate)-methyltransferase [Gammaproteobacteria bacterium]
MNQQRKAVALISGGLDSLLSARVVMEQGVHVEGINFFTGFCVEGHTHAIRKRERARPKRNNALWTAEQLGIKLHIIDIIEEYKDVLLHPRYGYGAHLNPCLDCKIFMVKKAAEWIEKNEFDFIVTGEVVGQRPMSQRKDTMPVVAQESGAEDLLLRPLCARNLPMTKPEREGWIDRSKLHDFSGRTRKPQIELAEKFGITDFAQPAGGCCFLTDEQYSSKLSDLWKYRGERRYDFDDIMLLKVGRHIRPASNYKLIIAREEGEVNFLQGYKKEYLSIKTISHMGPLALIDGKPSEEQVLEAAAIVARFSKGKMEDRVEVEITRQGGEVQHLLIKPLKPQEMKPEWML